MTRTRTVKRGARAVEAAGQRIIAAALERGVPKDEYGDLARVKREGHAAARALGHELTKWKRRAYAPNTAATAYCRLCRCPALIDLERSSAADGPALSQRCTA